MPHHASHKNADAAERSDLDPPEEPTGLEQTPTTEDWAAGREQPDDDGAVHSQEPARSEALQKLLLVLR
jgi:hypothetical protein